MERQKKFSLEFIASYLGAELIGDPKKQISSIAPINSATSEQISFLNNPKYTKYLKESNAGAVLLNSRLKGSILNNMLIVDDAYLAYSKLTNLFVINHSNSAIASSCTIGNGCNISSKDVHIADKVVVGNNVCIESSVVIKPGVVIGNNVTIRSGTVINPNVTVYDRVSIGEDCIIHSGVVIGADGFGFAKEKSGAWSKIHQLGTVVIGNNVEIGANTTIDCGALDDTIVHDGVKLDNQIQIGHNVEIGKNTIMAGCSAVAGSTKIGANCAIGGFSVIAGHINICDNVMITGGSGVSSSINEPGIYSGGAAGVIPNKIWRKNVVRYKNLDELARKVIKLEKQFDTLLNTKSEKRELESA